MRQDRLSRATIAFALAMICYTANGRAPGWGDTVSSRYLPFSILRHGDFTLDEFPQAYRRRDNYWAKYVRGAWISFYPVGAAIAAVPFYAPAVMSGRLSPDDELACRWMEKAASAALVALSVAFLHLALLRMTGPAIATAITVAYALGTSSMSVSSQELWQHGPAQLCFSLALFLLVEARGGRPWLAAAAGFPLAFAVVCRPTNLMPFLPLAAYTVLTHRRAILGFAAAASLPALFQLAYNLTYFGTPVWLQFPLSDAKHWHSGGPLSKLAGLLFSPSRGLFFYSPFLAFGVAGLGIAWRRDGDRLIRAIGVGLLMALALHARWWNWWGGGSYGPRLTADLTPLLAFAVVPCAVAIGRSRIVGALFAVTVAWSVFAHVSGAYWDDATWNRKIQGSGIAKNLWLWTDNQLVDAAADMARAVGGHLGLRTVPLDGNVAAGLRDRGEKDTRRDHYWTELAELHRRAGDEAAAASVEQIRRQRFTPSERRDWAFEDELTLLGIDHEFESPSVLRLTYYWRAERWLAADYAMTTNLHGKGCHLKSEFVLGYPDATTKTWNPGETFKAIDRLELPADFPVSGCALELGVWAPTSRRKLYIRRWPVWKRRGRVLRVLREPAGFSVASLSGMSRGQ